MFKLHIKEGCLKNGSYNMNKRLAINEMKNEFYKRNKRMVII